MKITVYTNDKTFAASLLDSLESSYSCSSLSPSSFTWDEDSIHILDHGSQDIIDGLQGQSIVLYSKEVDFKSSSHFYIHRNDLSTLRNTIDLMVSSKLNVSKVATLKQRFRGAFECSGAGMAIVDLDNRFVKVNKALCHMLGYSEEELLLLTFQDVTHEEDYDVGSRIVADFKEGRYEPQFIEKRYIHKSGSDVWVSINASPIIDTDSKPSYFVTQIQDITERMKIKKEVEKRAYFDDLTSLPNRALFNDRANVAIANSLRNDERCAILFIDLDNFKGINDSMGHAAGDELLIKVASILEDCIRKTDTVARIGGDEFAILLPKINNIKSAVKLSNRIIGSFKKPMNIKNKEIYATSSIGFSILPEDGNDFDSLIKNADAAMYKAKNMGRNRFAHYSKKLNNELKKNVEMEEYIADSIKNNKCDVFLQPKVCCTTDKVIGFESLVRFKDIDDNISMDKYIQIAEESDTIVSIDRFVIDRSLESARNFIDRYDAELKVSLNISARHLRKNDLIPFIIGKLKEYKISPSSIELEITESSIINDLKPTIEVLEKIKKLGIGIAIDDFGTGYASLDYLKNLPCTSIKIDKTFISGVIDNEYDKSISSFIIDLGKSLKLDVVAEGIENKEQLEFIVKRGCTSYQGYLYSRPVPIDKFAKLFL